MSIQYLKNLGSYLVDHGLADKCELKHPDTDEFSKYRRCYHLACNDGVTSRSPFDINLNGSIFFYQDNGLPSPDKVAKINTAVNKFKKGDTNMTNDKDTDLKIIKNTVHDDVKKLAKDLTKEEQVKQANSLADKITKSIQKDIKNSLK